jgi:pimeloyl-ACP methyl ester carboxylesterase
MPICVRIRAVTVSRAEPLRSESVGDGPTIVLLHGFAMQPSIYLPMARLLADRVRVVIPHIFALPERWTFEHALDCLELTLDDLDAERVSLLGHSFGGGLELGLAARSPDRIIECVFSDTLGVSREFGLAREALSDPLADLRLATPAAVSAFVRSCVTHPVQVAASALWAFSSDRSEEMEICAMAGIPCHVLWAEQDTILNRRDGMEFARRLHATFTVADRPPGYGPIDHDWMFDDPELFVAHLEKLGLRALPAATASEEERS